MKRILAVLLLAVGPSIEGATVFQSSFETPPDSSASNPQWKNLVYRPSIADPVFAGSDFSGVSGGYFALATGIYVDCPTKPGTKYTASFTYSATDSFTLPQAPFSISLITEVSAFHGTHEEIHHGQPQTIDDLSAIGSRQTSLALPGTHNWRMHNWRELSVAFVAQTLITRIALKSAPQSATSFAAIDQFKLDSGYSTHERQRIERLRRLLSKLKSRLEHLERQENDERIIQTKRKIHNAALMLEKIRLE